MRGSFARTTQTTAPPDVVWATLHDVDRLATYSSHLGPVTAVEPGRRWETSLQDRVGPFRLSAPMDVELVEEIAMEEIAIRASGQDRGPGTKLIVEASVFIGRQEQGAKLTLDGWYDLTGRVANLGAAVAKRQAETMIDEFWANLTEGLRP